MFGRDNKDNSVVSENLNEFFNKKTEQLRQRKRILSSRIDQLLNGRHKHFFTRSDLLALNHNARCKICGMTVAEYRIQKRIDNWTPNLKPVIPERPEKKKPGDPKD